MLRSFVCGGPKADALSTGCTERTGMAPSPPGMAPSPQGRQTLQIQCHALPALTSARSSPSWGESTKSFLCLCRGSALTSEFQRQHFPSPIQLWCPTRAFGLVLLIQGISFFPAFLRHYLHTFPNVFLAIGCYFFQKGIFSWFLRKFYPIRVSYI